MAIPPWCPRRANAGPGWAWCSGASNACSIPAAGCGHTLKQYGELLDGSHGAGFASQVRDVHEYLAELGLSESFRASLRPLQHADGQSATADNPVVVAYHDACHMIHGQGISAEPRQLLRAIPHLQLREATEAGVCCGSAGIYNLVQPEEAAALGQIKAADLKSTGAELVASANIGCTLQLRRHLPQAEGPHQRTPSVAHPMELLHRSASGGKA